MEQGNESKRIGVSLDPGFLPMIECYRDFCGRVERSGHKPLELCVFRKKCCTRFRFDIFAEPCPENVYFAERIAKSMLWSAGGFRIYVAGDDAVAESLKARYCPGGARAFDAELMGRVFEHPFEVLSVRPDEIPELRQIASAAGGTFEGCRIGFDAGGSDRKVVAIRDGKIVYSEEVDWSPKLQTDGAYHVRGIEQAIENAAAHLPRVDGIGVSSAGICVDNKLMESSLFRKLPPDQRERMKNIYIDVANKYGVPLTVANDGDVTALAGAIKLGRCGVLGIAMGTSEAAGYLDRDCKLKGWLSELSSVSIDARPDAELDAWTGDLGCGGRYLSQDAVVRLAERAGMELTADTPAGKLKQVQQRMNRGDAAAFEVFSGVGVYLGYALAYYALFYQIDEVLVLGRVMSGRGGEVILEQARAVLRQYPELHFSVDLPDERDRRLGQAFAAASMPVLRRHEDE